MREGEGEGCSVGSAELETVTVMEYLLPCSSPIIV